MEYPKHDDQFEETTVAEVRGDREHGWEIKRGDGWSFFVPADSPVTPEVGMVARFYGKGIGYGIRGLYLDGQCVFYRTVEHDEAHHNRQTYGATAAEWLAKWDNGDSVWSIEMGGIGPGYEQAIQITVAEIIRDMIANHYDASEWEDKEVWKRDREAIEKRCFANEVIGKQGLSGAQWGAAMNLATMLYKRGPIEVMTDERVKDRHILVSKRFGA